MGIPSVIYLKNSSLASWGITTNTKYQIHLETDDTGDPNNPSDPGNQNAAPPGVGMFYNTNESTVGNNVGQMWSKFLGWLDSADETTTPTLVGTKLFGFLLLPVADNGSTLTIGPADGEKAVGKSKGDPFPDAGSFNYSVNTQPPASYDNLLEPGNSGGSALNTGNFGRVPRRFNTSPLYKPFTANGQSGGILITPNFLQRNVQVHFVNASGNILGYIDANHVKKPDGSSYHFWVPFNNSSGYGNIFMVAAVQPVKDPNNLTWHFNIGDPRTDGSMTVEEIP